VALISTVSGGSLAIGLVLAQAGKWPTAAEFERETLPKCRTLLTQHDLLRRYILATLIFPWRVLRGRAAVLASVIRKLWNLNLSLQDLPCPSEITGGDRRPSSVI
jgi:NTE family protein